MGRTFASLEYPNYRKWFFGALVANNGTWMQRIAQTWIVLTELTDDSAFAVSIVVALQFLPVMLLTPIGGILADKVDRRALIQVTQAALAVLSLALGVMALTDVLVLWHVYVFALLLGLIAAMDAPVRQTFVTELVPPTSLANAVGLNGASFNLARILGPAIAGFMLAAWDSGWVFLLTGLAFLGPILSVASMRDDDMYGTAAPRTAGQTYGLGEAVRYVRDHADIAVIMVMMAFVAAFALNFQLFISIMTRDAFDRGPEDYGILNTLMGLGALTGALLAARRTRPRTRIVVFSALALGVNLLLIAVAPTYLVFALLHVPAGFFTTTMLNSANSTIQLASEPPVRGRVMSLYLMVFLGSTPIASPVMGWIGEVLGARASVAIGAGITILTALLVILWAWRRWGIRVVYELRPHLAIHVINPVDVQAAAAQAGDPFDQHIVDDATETARAADGVEQEGEVLFRADDDAPADDGEPEDAPPEGEDETR